MASVTIAGPVSNNVYRDIGRPYTAGDIMNPQNLINPPATTTTRTGKSYNQYDVNGNWAGAQPPTGGQQYWSAQTKSYITAPKTTGFLGGGLVSAPVNTGGREIGGVPRTTASAQPYAPQQSQVPYLNQTIGQGTDYAGRILQTGFDPQKDLYNRTLQQLQDQARVAQAARGITMSPYGAGLEQQALSNFNIDWQNAQLARQQQALQGYATGVGPGLQQQGMYDASGRYASDLAQRQYEFGQNLQQQELDRQNRLALAQMGVGVGTSSAQNTSPMRQFPTPGSPDYPTSWSTVENLTAPRTTTGWQMDTQVNGQPASSYDVNQQRMLQNLQNYRQQYLVNPYTQYQVSQNMNEIANIDNELNSLINSNPGFF